MKSYEVLKKAVDRVGAKEVASSLGISTSLVYKWCEAPKSDEAEDASGTKNPLDRVQTITECLGSDELMAWLCEQNNGFFVKNPKSDPEKIDTEFVRHTQKIIQDFSELLNVMSQSISNDNAIDQKEAKQIRSEWESLKQYGEEFTSACEQGIFDPKK